MDVYEPGPGSQLHDFNPSPPVPTGLFWTIRLRDENVDADVDDGRATYHVRNAPVFDHGNIGHALLGGPPPPTPARVSFTVEWHGVTSRQYIHNTTDHHAGEFVFNSAQMDWTAEDDVYRFQSAPLSTSTSAFALVGNERNGIFFDEGH